MIRRESGIGGDGQHGIWISEPGPEEPDQGSWPNHIAHGREQESENVGTANPLDLWLGAAMDGMDDALEMQAHRRWSRSRAIPDTAPC